MTFEASHDSHSYWQTTTPHVPLSTDLPPRTEVAIIGGGIMGVATGYWLAKAGAEVCLLEQTALASGATGRNGGFVALGHAQAYPTACHHLGKETAQTLLRLTLTNQALVKQVVAEEQISCEYSNAGGISLATDEQRWSLLSEEATLLHAEGLHTTMLDHKQLQEWIKTPLSPEILGGRWLGEDGVWHPLHFLAGLLHAAQRSGARAFHAKAERLALDQGHPLIHTTQGPLRADTVIVAANAWIPELLPLYRDLIVPVRGQMLAYAPVPNVFPGTISASLSSTEEYWQQRADGTIVLGGCRAVAPNADTHVMQSTPTPEVQTALEGVFPSLFPQLKPLRVQQRWAGLMAFTPDLLPIADQVPDLPGVWVAGGFSGHGMPFGMRLSQLLAEAITAGRRPDELQLFRRDRPTLPATQ
ncbi:MAG TPA: FAD-binding oxidoreductase [Ktedonobacteraceae bacterium]